MPELCVGTHCRDWMRARWAAGLVILIASIAVLLPTVAVFAQGDHPVQIESGHASNTISIANAGDQLKVTVTCPRGISFIKVHRIADAWPKRFVVRLHLKGLENLVVDNGFERIQAEVSSTDHQIRQNTIGDKAVAVAADDPRWLNIRNHSAQDSNAQAGSESYFDVRIPARLLRPDAKSIRLQWIDFYRN